MPREHLLVCFLVYLFTATRSASGFVRSKSKNPSSVELGEPCLSDPCKHGSTCANKKKTINANLTSWFMCKCLPGFSGDHCESGPQENCKEACYSDRECRLLDDPSPDGRLRFLATIVWFEAESMDKKAVSSVYVYPSGHVCTCKAGLRGARCKEKCPKGFFGRLCVFKCERCKKNDCSRIDGKCKKGCIDGFMGEDCQAETKCKTGSSKCKNGFCKSDPSVLSDLKKRNRKKLWEAKEKESTTEPQQCICDNGFQGTYCKTKCKKEKKIADQKYGFMCIEQMQETCSRCRNPRGRCSVRTGECTKCPKGYQPPYCAKPGELTSPAPETAEISIQTDPEDTASMRVEMQYSGVEGPGTTDLSLPGNGSEEDVQLEMNSVNKRIRKQAVKLDSERKKNQELEDEVAKLRKEKEELEKQAEVYQLVQGNKPVEDPALKKEVDRLEKELTDKTKTNNELLEDSLRLIERLAEVKREATTVEKTLVSLTEQVENLENENTILKESLVVLTRQQEGQTDIKKSVQTSVAGTLGGKMDDFLTTIRSMKTEKSNIRQRRQDPEAAKYRLLVNIDIALPPDASSQPGLEGAVTSAVKRSGNLLQSEAFPGLKLNRSSVLVKSVVLPKTKSVGRESGVPTHVLYVASAVLLSVVISAAVTWYCMCRQRKPKKQGLPQRRGTASASTGTRRFLPQSARSAENATTKIRSSLAVTTRSQEHVHRQHKKDSWNSLKQSASVV